MTAAKALEHDWITQYSISSWKDENPIDEAVKINLLSFKRAETLKQAVLTYLATQLCEQELDDMKKAFMALDANSDGKLSKEELVLGLKGKIDEEAINGLLEKIDTDGNGFINYNGNQIIFFCLFTFCRVFSCFNGTANLFS